MAATSNFRTSRIRMLLDNGTTSSGMVKTLTSSLGYIKQNIPPTDNDSAQKVYNIIKAAAPLLAKSIYSLQNVAIYNIQESA